MIEKSFLLEEKIVEYLAYLAKKRGLTESQIIEDIIEKEYAKLCMAEKLS